MEYDVRQLVDDYLQAAGGKDWARLAQVLHPAALFGGTVKAETRGSDAFVQGFQNIAPIYLRYDVRQVLVDGLNAGVLYDFVTDTSVGNVLSAEFLTTDGRRITGTTLLFDLRRWPEVVEELARRRTARQAQAAPALTPSEA